LNRNKKNKPINTVKMKKSAFNLLVILLSVTLLSISSTLMAQGQGRGQGPGNGDGPGFRQGNQPMDIPGLTEVQKASIDKLRVAHFRKAELSRAEIGEKEARLKTLKLAEPQDIKAIDNLIDEISTMRGNLMKAREAHHREVKALLTDEQKVFFDSRPGRGADRGDRNHRNGKGNRQGCRGECPYSGR
jgi:Spy/CpxP family protein refolding chaperone